MLTPEKLKKAFKIVEEESWILRSFLKGQDEDEVDRLINALHNELFEGFDCVSCSNCCKEIVPTVEENNILAISDKLEMTVDEFKLKYLVKTDEGLEINIKPCPFLTNEGCSIYDCRPEACRDYPFTDKNEVTTRLMNLVFNCEVCPIVFEIFERLKRYYGDEFEEFMEEYG